MNKIELFQQMLVTGAVLVPTLTIITEAFKRTFGISKRFVPLLAMTTGIGFTLMFMERSFVSGAAGAMLGLGSIGFWEIGKTTIMGKRTAVSEEKEAS